MHRGVLNVDSAPESESGDLQNGKGSGGIAEDTKSSQIQDSLPLNKTFSDALGQLPYL